MKATFSLPNYLFEELDALAKERQQPRSALVAVALQHFLREQRLAEARRQLDVAYPPNEPSSDEEEAFLQFSKRALRARIKSGEWEW